MNKRTNDLLYRSLDSPLGDAEQAELERVLKESAALRAEKKRIEKLREVLTHSGEKKFKPFFAERVLQRLALPERRRESEVDFFSSLVFLFRRVAVAAALVCLLMIAYNIIENNGLSMNNLLGFQEYTIEDVWLPANPSYWENVQ
jgi:anti-sigma factor RsiW